MNPEDPLNQPQAPTPASTPAPTTATPPVPPAPPATPQSIQPELNPTPLAPMAPNPTPQQPVPQPNTTTVTPVKNSGGVLKLIATALILIVALVVGFFVWGKSKPSANLDNTPKATQQNLSAIRKSSGELKTYQTECYSVQLDKSYENDIETSSDKCTLSFKVSDDSNGLDIFAIIPYPKTKNAEDTFKDAEGGYTALDKSAKIISSENYNGKYPVRINTISYEGDDTPLSIRAEIYVGSAGDHFVNEVLYGAMSGVEIAIPVKAGSKDVEDVKAFLKKTSDTLTVK